MILFGASNNELDDILFLVASDVDELSGSVAYTALLQSSASRSARLKADDVLIRVMSKAVNELGLEWCPPEETSRSRLEEWFLPGRHQALRQHSSPFFPEVHDELTKSWRAPYSSCVRPSTSISTKIYIECSASYRKSEQLNSASVTALKVALLRSREFLGG